MESKQSGPGSNGNEVAFHTPQIARTGIMQLEAV